MTRRTVAIGACLALVILAAPALAASSGSGSRSKSDTSRTRKASPKQDKVAQLSGEYAAMAEQLGCSEAQKKRMADAVQAKEKSLAAWEGQYGKKLAELKQKDDASGQVAAQIEALGAARARVEAQGHARVLATLTAEQRQTWESKKLCDEVIAHFKTARITDQQLTTIDKMCKEAAANLATDTAADARETTLAQLIATVEQKVLTAEQKGKTAKTTGKSKTSTGKSDKKSYGREKTDNTGR